MSDICIATGCFYQLDLNQVERLEYIRDLGANGAEITFGSTEDVMAADGAALADAVSGLDHVSIHAPIRDDITRDDDGRAVLERLDRLREQIGATGIVFHPDMIPDLSFVQEHTQPFIENMQRRKGFDRNDFAAVVGDSDVPLVIDICHAATWGQDEISHLFDTYDDRITHVHASAYSEEEHELLVDTPAFLDDALADHLSGRTIVLENVLDDKQKIRDELSFVRNHIR